MLAAGPIRGLPLGEIDAALSQPGAFNTSATQNSVTDPSSPSLFEQGGSALTTLLVLQKLLGNDDKGGGLQEALMSKIMGDRLGLEPYSLSNPTQEIGMTMDTGEVFPGTSGNVAAGGNWASSIPLLSWLFPSG